MRLIDGVKIKELRVIPDERGFLFEMLRCDDDLFQKFGQVYLTAVYPGVVKGWHFHKIQTDNFVCVHGMAKVVLYDGREGSPTHGEVNEFFMGDLRRILLLIPPLVMHGFKGVGTEMAMIVNCPTEAYNPASPDEYRLAWNSDQVPYDWSIKQG